MNVKMKVYKKYLMALVATVLLLIGAGCAAPVNDSSQPTPLNPPDQEQDQAQYLQGPPQHQVVLTGLSEEEAHAALHDGYMKVLRFSANLFSEWDSPAEIHNLVYFFEDLYRVRGWRETDAFPSDDNDHDAIIPMNNYQAILSQYFNGITRELLMTDAAMWLLPGRDALGYYHGRGSENIDAKIVSYNQEGVILTIDYFIDTDIGINDEDSALNYRINDHTYRLTIELHDDDTYRYISNIILPTAPEQASAAKLLNLLKAEQLTGTDELNGAFRAYYALHPVEMSYLPVFDAEQTPDWTDLRSYILASFAEAGIIGPNYELSEKEFRHMVRAYFGDMKFTPPTTSYYIYWETEFGSYTLTNIMRTVGNIYTAQFTGSWPMKQETVTVRFTLTDNPRALFRYLSCERSA